MKINSKYIVVAAVIFCMTGAAARAQEQQKEQKPLTMDDMITKQVDDLIDRFKLDEVQAFRIDTLLQHYVPIYNQEVQHVKASGAAQANSYQVILDKWGEFFDNEYQKIFDEKQWAQYLKSYAGKEKKKRDKRLAAARGEKVK